MIGLLELVIGIGGIRNWHGEGRMDTLHALCSAEERRIGPAAYGLLLTLGYLGAHRFYCRLAMNSLRGAPGA